jgi:hypothetical protein
MIGVKCLFSVSRSRGNETTLKTIGNYIYFHGMGYGVAIFTRDGRLVKFIKRTDASGGGATVRPSRFYIRRVL